MKKHLKSLSAPKSWKFARKETMFIAKPLPGKHKLSEAIPLSFVLKNMLHHATIKKEVKELLNKKMVTIDAQQVHDTRHNVGLFDVVDFPAIKESYRIFFDHNGKLTTVKIPEKEKCMKPLKIIRKMKLKGGKMQLNFYDGSNMNVEKDAYHVGDSVLYNLQSKKIEQHLPLDVGTYIFVIDGKHQGKHGVIEEIIKLKNSEDIVLFKKGDVQYSTAKKYAYAIGNKKSTIFLGDEE